MNNNIDWCTLNKYRYSFIHIQNAIRQEGIDRENRKYRINNRIKKMDEKAVELEEWTFNLYMKQILKQFEIRNSVIMITALKSIQNLVILHSLVAKYRKVKKI